jgi:predicted MFS family arabinose efflux permease
VYADATRAAILFFMALFVPTDKIVWLLGFLFLSQTFRTLYDTSVIPLASDLTNDQARLAKATANLKMIFHASFILGLGVGGFVSYHLRPQYIFMIDGATFIFSALLIGSIPLAKSVETTYKTVLKEMFAPKYYIKWFHLVGDGLKMIGGHEYRKTVIVMAFAREFAYGLLNPLGAFWPQALFSAVKNGLGISAAMVGLGCVLGGLFSNRYISGKLSQKELFFRLCVLLAVAELAATGLAYTCGSFVLFAVSSLVAAVFMNLFEIGVFVKYISTAKPDEKGALTGFFQFTMRSAIFLGGGVYAFIADKLPVRALPLVPMGILAISVILLLFRKRSFQSA